MDTPSQTAHVGFGVWLMVGIGVWLLFGGLYMSLGVFSPKYRARRGRSTNPGPKMSVPEQALWALAFVGFGVLMIYNALH